jgi:hypothetical protein
MDSMAFFHGLINSHMMNSAGFFPALPISGSFVPRRGAKPFRRERNSLNPAKTLADELADEPADG